MSEIAITRGATRERPLVLPAAAAAAFAVAMAILALAWVGVRVSTPWDGNQWAQQDAGLFAGGDGFRVIPVAAHSNLRPDDVVIAINATPLLELPRAPLAVPDLPFDSSLEYLVVRDGQRLTVEQALRPFAPVLLLREWPSIVTVGAWVAIAAYVLRRRPHDPAAQVMLVMGAAFLPGMLWLWIGISDLYGGPMLALIGAYQPIYYLGIAAIVGLVAVFPRPAPWAVRHRRLVIGALALPVLVSVIILALAQLSNEPMLGWGSKLAVVEATLYIGGAVLLAVAVPLRYRSLADPADRRRLLLVMGTMALVTFAVIGIWMLPSMAWGAPLLPWSAAGAIGIAIPVALAVAILRYGAFDLKLLVSRSLVYGGATAAIALIYVTLVGAAILVVHERFGFAVALLATGFVIVIAQPVRDGVQRTVNRVIYGDRDDPYQGIARLKERIETALAGEQVLPVVVETIASSLRLPYVAIELEQENGPIIAVARGHAPAEPVAVPLVHQSELVGRLLVAPRTGEERLSETDHRLLSALATQVSAAIKTMQLDEELRRSRERLVAAREEERRRLRRELHDGIGPTLAGSLLQLQAARAALAADPRRAEELLAKLETETREAIGEVRRVARDLRPPALDALGLVGALREQAGHFSADPALDVEVTTRGALPKLPAAHEVAAYRIVLEALANVVRHADAKHCTIHLEAGDTLVVTISDDGKGVAPAAPVGVGLRSMRERAAELGGTLQVQPRPGGGTVVQASLPLAGAGS